MDFNENVDRKSKVDADGNTRYKMKVWYYFLIIIHYSNWLKKNRAGDKATVVEQKMPKDYSFMKNIFDLCVDCIETGLVPTPEVIFNVYFIMP